MSKRKAFWWLVAICAIVRIGVGLIYTPFSEPDTPAYQDLALRIFDWHFAGFEGGRTPGFPLLLLATGFNDHLLHLVQAVMGICISLMLFDLVLRRTESAGLAFAAGVAYTLSMTQLFFEAALMTETFDGFLITVGFWIYVRFCEAPRYRVVIYAMLGVVVALAALTRPQAAALVPILIGFLVWRPVVSLRQRG